MDGSEKTPDGLDGEKYRLELNKTRLDLAWKHFEHYAKQRVTMFNFHIIFIGALFYAFATTLKAESHVEFLHIGIGMLGFAACIMFYALDQRNQYLYRLAEYNIFVLERNFFYADDARQLDRIRVVDPDSFKHKAKIRAEGAASGKYFLETFYQGVVSEEFLQERSNLQRFKRYHHGRLHHYFSYRFVMPCFYFVTAAIFAAMIVYALTLEPATASAAS